MTNEEAIEKLKANIEVDENVMKLFNLNDCPDFKLDILACKSAINALEKQIPKKIVNGACPCCNCAVWVDGNYCDVCGQRLDWSDK